MLCHKILKFSVRINSYCCVLTSRRWATNIYKLRERERKLSVEKAVAHFDDFYGSLYRDQWPSIRLALLCAEKKAIVINNFSDKERVSKDVQAVGAFNVREVCNVQRKKLSKTEELAPIYQIEGRIEDTLLRLQQADLEDIYPAPLDPEAADKIAEGLAGSESNIKQEDEEKEGSGSPQDPTKDKPLAEALKSADYDTSRIIVPGLSGMALNASLYDFLPATKLKGMDDFIPESAHYKYYSDAPVAPIEIEAENDIEFPGLLDIYAFERGNCDNFEYSKRGSTDVLDYHLMKLGLLAPVLALALKQGEVVLDMTSSSLDISILISQTLIPGAFVINCGTSMRARYVMRHIDSHFFDDKSNVVITDYHPLDIRDAGKFDKIIVGAPSTYDRRAMTIEEENPFNPSRVKQRIRLPELQLSYLKKALESVKEGGSVVYYTETLSPVQNDAVVQKALDDLWFKNNMQFTVRDLSKGMEMLQPFMKIVKPGKYGHLVTPFLPNNCGPVYFTKLVKCATDQPTATASEPNKKDQD